MRQYTRTYAAHEWPTHTCAPNVATRARTHISVHRAYLGQRLRVCAWYVPACTLSTLFAYERVRVCMCVCVRVCKTGTCGRGGLGTRAYAYKIRTPRPANWAFLYAGPWIKIINGEYIRMSKRRLIYGSVRRFEAGPVISQKPRICGLGLDFCFYSQTNQRGRSTARVYVRRWIFFFFHYSSLFKLVRPGGPWYSTDCHGYYG